MDKEVHECSQYDVKITEEDVKITISDEKISLSTILSADAMDHIVEVWQRIQNVSAWQKVIAKIAAVERSSQ